MCIKRDCILKKLISFVGLFYLLSKYLISYFPASVSYTSTVLGYLPNLKKGLNWLLVSIFNLFCSDTKIFPIWYTNWPSFNITSQNIQQCVFKFQFRQITSLTFKIYPWLFFQTMAGNVMRGKWEATLLTKTVLVLSDENFGRW